MPGLGITNGRAGERILLREESLKAFCSIETLTMTPSSDVCGWKNNSGNDRRRKVAGKSWRGEREGTWWIIKSWQVSLSLFSAERLHQSTQIEIISEWFSESRAKERSSWHPLTPDTHKGSPCPCRPHFSPQDSRVQRCRQNCGYLGFRDQTSSKTVKRI